MKQIDKVAIEITPEKNTHTLFVTSYLKINLWGVSLNLRGGGHLRPCNSDFREAATFLKGYRITNAHLEIKWELLGTAILRWTTEEVMVELTVISVQILVLLTR